jgi:SAM-dependent methyltransferase
LTEAFQPVAVRPPGDNRALFALRCLVDLQLLTVFRFLRRELPNCRGRVLDVGAGQAPWRALLSQAEYIGLDIETAGEFGMQRTPGVVYYDGGTMPFIDGSVDHVLCAEVLEHVADAPAFIGEIARVLRTGGTLVLTIPWSARLHHLPHDYRRLTRHGLAALLRDTGFHDIRIEERGNDVAVVANKIIVMMIRMMRPRPLSRAIWCWPLVLLLAPVGAGFMLAAHIAMQLGIGSREDPLGYGAVASRT